MEQEPHQASVDIVIKKKPKKRCMMCWWTVFFGWFLVVAVTGVCAFFTILYTFNYGLVLSIQWLKSLLICWVSDLFVQQPIKVLGMALFISLLLRKPEDIQHIDTEVLTATTDQGRKFNFKYLKKLFLIIFV
jgi:hypothetical protein